MVKNNMPEVELCWIEKNMLLNVKKSQLSELRLFLCLKLPTSRYDKSNCYHKTWF